MIIYQLQLFSFYKKKIGKQQQYTNKAHVRAIITQCEQYDNNVRVIYILRISVVSNNNNNEMPLIRAININNNDNGIILYMLVCAKRYHKA